MEEIKGPKIQMVQGQQLSTPCDEASIKQALAIAIVRQKRKCTQEADEWRTKAEVLATSNAAIKAWAAGILQCRTATAAQDSAAATTDEGTCVEHIGGPSIFLPPLTIRMVENAEQYPSSPALQACFSSVQQQLLLTAQAASCKAAASVLSGKAAALSDMLLTNLHMLQQLHHPDKPATAAAISLGMSMQSTNPTDTMSALDTFIQGTLLQVHNSSLRQAYMQQCAALLAALVSQPIPDASQRQVQPSQQAAAPAGKPLQQLLHKQQSNSQVSSVAAQAVGLMRQLLRLKSVELSTYQLAQHQQPVLANSKAPTAASSSVQQAATAMLQHLSSFPGTALLMALAVAQQLQQAIQRLQQANALTGTVQLGALDSSRLAAGEQALSAAAELFEASHQLIQELEQAFQQLPAWAIALSSNDWTVKALEDLVSMTTSMYSSCTGLQQHQYLLADKLCNVAASLATMLQHLATAADAPGMRSHSGAALRSACGGLCMQMRDVFMPAGMKQ